MSGVPENAAKKTPDASTNGERKSRLPDLLDDPRVQKEIEDFDRFIERKRAKLAKG